ncbi:hypothetical protein HO133_005965 [Letharia lupina]|uniref:Uncharacterized protein n=1 Tax=Letharia lupina TaxID=560253 RepID=A0A8H6F8J9_9LECA|nr:uncharacterized protein HO133_005965 [Letharia lupina]KAF6218614.1 hypothetical protein HO133_005965 [Letharia lupina]
MSLLMSLALAFLAMASQVTGQSTVTPQPYCHPVAGNFSNNADYWLHATPVLRAHWCFDYAPLVRRQYTDYWTGWKNISFLFAFGDSYTSTSFNIAGKQPSLSNPLGNPSYPGSTSADGPNYIDFLTTTYNESYIQAYNLGYGGATIDDSIVMSGFGTSVHSFQDQVENGFLHTYVNNSKVPWTASNSLFTIFFGVNDVTNSFAPFASHNDSVNYELVKAYESLVDELYAAGARNFLFMNVPPVDRSPGTLEMGSIDQSAEASFIGAFNFRLGALVYNLALRHADTTLFTFDTNFLFTRVLDDPSQFGETAGYLNTTNYCAAYENGTSSLTSLDPSCGIPVDQYFWLNSLHPTYPMHNFMGSQIAKILSG